MGYDSTGSFEALVVDKRGGALEVGLREMQSGDLPPGEVLIRVRFSSLNYKDALACQPDGGIIRTYPMVPGIDLAGEVLESSDSRFSPGERVLATGFGLGVTHFGGLSPLARVPADWVVRVPPQLDLRDAMALGTAGFTAAISIERLEHNGLWPGQGPVLVTGATGGVGSCAVALLAAKGYEVAASTGKEAEHEYLRALGARHIVARRELSPDAAVKPLEKQTWAAAVDPVGGRSLAFVLASIRYGGSVAVSGLTGGGAVPTTVHPFILRGVSLLGIDSVQCPIERRYALWADTAEALQPTGTLELICARTVRLRDVPSALQDLLAGRARGRIIVEL
ncbi:acryloyl-CoA reductase [Paenibacillus xerothermodurans]|uniref:Oxidoreductase n=1 Tax=Paenibacillus xerothermodurans TaxID=1977292 RepID=A0A2W1N5F8_PAEXE|nr:acryloyl-CoA reductase [Paenibacillus xerothermodurans]PZE19617.1 oxidoreductase [Paenibacillus xerothermodurans]